MQQVTEHHRCNEHKARSEKRMTPNKNNVYLLPNSSSVRDVFLACYAE